MSANLFLPIADIDSEMYELILQEEQRQLQTIELIASENYQSKAVRLALASKFGNKYAEGFPNKRYYGGNEVVDKMEQLVINRAKKIFHADHANVQALSGAAANLCVYTAYLQPGDTILGLKLSDGGHLTHGAKVTFFSKIFNFVNYGVDENGWIDYKQLENLALEHKPKLIIAGFSAYPRNLDYGKFLEIGKKVGAMLYADISHIGGFVAAGIMDNPLDFGFNAMMTTTHKSLRGPRGAIILSKGKVSNPLKKVEKKLENLPTLIDRAVFPGMQGGPHENVIAGIGVALKEAESRLFKNYAKQTLINAKIMAEEFLKLNYKLLTGGTDNHMIILDFRGTKIDGKIAQETLNKVGISTSKSSVPFDPNPPYRPSGLRIGIQAMTSRGIKENDVIKIVKFIDLALRNVDNEDFLVNLKHEIVNWVKDFS